MVLERDNSVPGCVLVIAAHPDDFEFGCAGSVARWVAAGAHVVYCVLTDGSSGSDDPATDKQALARTRVLEQRAAAAVVGVTDVRFMNQPDGELEPSLALRRELVKLIREVRPDRIICQDPTTLFVRNNYINHPDHRAAGQVAIDAIFPASQSPLIFHDLLGEGYLPHKVRDVYVMLTGEPDTAVDISEVIDIKLQALQCHKSQIAEADLDWVREFNGEAGSQIGAAFAETYRVMHINEEAGDE